MVLRSPISRRVGFTGVFLVLGFFANRAKLENPVLASDRRMPGDQHMGADDGVFGDLDMLTKLSNRRQSSPLPQVARNDERWQSG